MRPIDADELKKDLTRFYDNEVTAKQLIDEQPTIEPEQRWIPVTEESVIQAGYEGREVRFRIRGRLFAIRELAQ